MKLSLEKLTVYTSAILNAGYKFSLSHANKSGIKTTAPLSFLWDIMRLQGQKNPKGQLGNLSEASPGYKIMSKVKIKRIVVFRNYAEGGGIKKIISFNNNVYIVSGAFS